MDDPLRRRVLQQAACVAAGWTAWEQAVAQAAKAPSPSAPAFERFEPCLLVDKFDRPLRAQALKAGEAMVFAWPYVATPAFLLAMDSPVVASAQLTEQGLAYQSPAGVGQRRHLVAFSAICAHKLMYPTPQVSFIGLRAGTTREPRQVIHCCGDDSRYDPQQGARVLAGPAPQPLAAIELRWDAQRDELQAVAVHGSHRFAAFFEKYAFKLDVEHGAKRARSLCGATTQVLPAAEHTKQWNTCKA